MKAGILPTDWLIPSIKKSTKHKKALIFVKSVKLLLYFLGYRKKH